MATSSRMQFGSFTIDAVIRTPITMPRGCSRIVVRNDDLSNACTLFDASTAGNSFRLTPGAVKEFPWPGFHGAPNEIFLWATADAGTGPLVTEYYS